MSLSSHAACNRELWDRKADGYQQAHQQQLAASGGAAWGVWQLPEWCGAAQGSIALHKLGARVVGLDNSERQLAHARSLMTSAAVDFPLAHVSAESSGLAGASFDIVFCDHGAMTFCDLFLSVPEAARLLRPGGLLAFSMHTPIVDIVWPLGTDHPAERFTRDDWDLHVLDDPGDPLAFQLPYGTWIRLFRENGLCPTYN